jgi:hypothetical protein
MENKITKDDAIAQLKDWADFLDVNTETDDFTAALDVLVKPVMSERLTFDLDREVFILKLAAPLEMANSKKEMVEIKELTLDEKRGIERFKDSEKISMVEAIYAKAAGLSIAEASKIKGRDFSVVTAINQVFFS